MYGKTYVIVFVFAVMSCRTEIDTRNTELDKLVESANGSFVENPTVRSTEIVNDILSRLTDFYRIHDRPNRELDNPELLTHVQLMDTTRTPRIYFSISTYKSQKSALIAFRNSIEFMACCIPDEDIVRLKNFETIKAFKNRSSKILYADNVVVTIDSGDRIEDNSDFDKLIDSYFDKVEFKKLEVGTGGPAIWTHE
jgi:hypothetical protein